MKINISLNFKFKLQYNNKKVVRKIKNENELKIICLQEVINI